MTDKSRPKALPWDAALEALPPQTSGRAMLKAFPGKTWEREEEGTKYWISEDVSVYQDAPLLIVRSL